MTVEEIQIEMQNLQDKMEKKYMKESLTLEERVEFLEDRCTFLQLQANASDKLFKQVLQLLH